MNMNWLDWIFLIALTLAAVKGFSRGFVVELASLLALALGIWAGLYVSEPVSEALGLEAEGAAVPFLVTFLLVLVGVHLLARLITTLIDLAELSLPNKLAGVAFGTLRAAFTLSIALKLVAGYSLNELPPKDAVDGSRLHAAIIAFAPGMIPALKDTKWLERAVQDLKKEAAQ